jgi:hypothetical protein
MLEVGDRVEDIDIEIVISRTELVEDSPLSGKDDKYELKFTDPITRRN